jgi:hypothetical protein
MKEISMNKKSKSFLLFFTLSSIAILGFFLTKLQGVDHASFLDLDQRYNAAYQTPSDMYEHVPTLRRIARDCSSVVEIGLRTMVSSWGILKGLSESSSVSKSYLGVDINTPPDGCLIPAKTLAQAHGITFTFWKKNDLDITIPDADFLFIDSNHIYAHLMYELETFSPHIAKYIAMHDTDRASNGEVDDPGYLGDYSEYPPFIDRTKSGLWPAVVDFLAHHPEWTLLERHHNCYGLTILKRISDTPTLQTKEGPAA